MLVLFCITLLLTTAIEAEEDLCAGCAMDNGAGYNKHPTACDKFVQCHYNADGNIVGEIQQCRYPTFWNEDLLTCSLAKDSPCGKSMCKNQPDGAIFGSNINCRGYFECRYGKAIAMCCPYGQKFDNKLGCINNDDRICFDDCFHGLESAYCGDKRAVLGKPEVFEQLVYGRGWIEMPCAYGTAYSDTSCLCVHAVDPRLKNLKCKPEVHLPFEESSDDVSDNKYYIRNENVEVEDGVAIFNGRDSRLVIPRFTNLEHSTSVVIKVKYSSNHANTSFSRAIVSNSDCGDEASILLSEDYANVYFGVGTSDVKFVYSYVPQEDELPSTSFTDKDVTYSFDGGFLKGVNGGVSKTVEAPGYLRNAHCALHIGYADNLQPFEGTIDEVSIYLCNPDEL